MFRLRIADCRLPIATLLTVLVVIFNCDRIRAQETPTPSSSETPSIGPTTSPEQASPSPTATSTARNVRISFLPPPLEGTISLGIYDSTGKLVRVLHQDASFDDFTIGADALITKWDGKDDRGQDLPPGKYHARGYLVGPLKVEKIEDSPSTAASPSADDKVQVKLMANPLVKNERPTIDLVFGSDDRKSFLKTADGLPLYKISDRGNVAQASLAKGGEKSIDVWQDNGTGPEHLRVTNVDKMIAFDCGEFELR